MQKQLNDCIRHHQQIIRCVYNQITKSKLILLFRIRETGIFLCKIKYVHIHGRTGNCNESFTVWAISAFLINYVFYLILRHHSEVLP
jgi:hypothetical protein